MCSTDIDPFAGLDDDLDNASTKADTRERFPCQACGGTGKWSGGRNRHGSTHCFSCKGEGYFLTSHRDRMKAREQRKQSKAKKVLDAQEAFNEANPDLIVTLVPMTSWNEFARSLVEQYTTRGSLSENQVNAARNMIAKVEATRAAKAAERDASTVEVDLTPIREMFEAAVASGRKKPTYRAEGLIISRAPDHGRNAGSLYVKTDDGHEYQGKITSDHKFRPVSDAAADTADKLAEIAKNPEEAAVRYGRKTGNCGLCGRELTKKESIEAGIGPTCAQNFGF